MSDIVERLRNNAMYPEDSRNAAADEIDRLRAEVASLKEERDTAKMNESFWKHAHKVDTDGLNVKVDHLTQQLAAANGRVEILVKAGQAVVDRWDMPKWKDAFHPDEYINALRSAISNLNEDGGKA
jgi:hypothetical protein